MNWFWCGTSSRGRAPIGPLLALVPAYSQWHRLPPVRGAADATLLLAARPRTPLPLSPGAVDGRRSAAVNRAELATPREAKAAELIFTTTPAMELGKNMSDEDTNLMLPQLAGDELLVEGVRTEKKRFR